MSFSISRAFTPARARFVGAISPSRVLASSSTRLYSSTKSVFNPQDIHNISHSSDHIQSKLPSKKQLRNANRFREFDLEDRVYAITGGGRGLGLSMGEALIEAGAKGMQLILISLLRMKFDINIISSLRPGSSRNPTP